MAYTTIDDPEAHFQVVTYTGNGSANNAITLPGDTDMQPDLVWIKNRDATDSHCMFDAVRGATKVIHSDADDAESTDTDTLDSFTSDGFQVDADVKVNTNTEKYVAWCWKANGSGSGNTAGDMASTVSANATAGFTIVTYDGEKNSGDTFGHGLGLVPAFMVFKNTEISGGWTAFHGKNTAAPETDYLIPSDTTATTDHNERWYDTMPTSTLVTVGDDNGVNADGNIIVSYIWSDIQGFSKFGSYKGNGDADGTFVYTGFRPALVITKRTDSTSSWDMTDSKRGYNNSNPFLRANGTYAEDTDGEQTLLSNGFKPENTNADCNADGGTYVYAAFAEAPFVNSNGVPCNAR